MIHGEWYQFDKSPEMRLREACNGFIDQGRTSVDWTEVADRARLEPDTVLRLLADMADDPETGVARKTP